MRPLYLSTPVRSGLGPCLRPGGRILTERIIMLSDIDEKRIILDAGCGQGTSMGFLRQSGAGTVIGFDLEPELLELARQERQPVARADLSFLPLPDACLDLVLCECVWNLTDRQKVLDEFTRVLRPGGRLALTDIYARQENVLKEEANWPVTCCFSQATSLTTVKEMVMTAGFAIVVLEDHSRLLTRTAAEFVFTHGSMQGFWQAVTGDPDLAEAACNAATAIRPGLFLCIGTKIQS